MLNSLEMRVRKTVINYRMLLAGDHVLAAVSGGADSIALLLCLHSLAAEFNLKISVAHLNHGIRGEEADEDEDFVRQMSERMGLPFISEKIEVKAQAREQRRNLEELARRMRYEFLHRAAQKAGAGKIAVGHNLNDQAETVLFRFLRGSGLEGLSAIHPVIDDVVIRPLLECSREQILTYLKSKATGYREDSTNADVLHARNCIRREVLPYLQKTMNPQLMDALVREAGLAREAWSYIQMEAQKLFMQIHSGDDRAITVDVNALLRSHPALQKEIVRQSIRECAGNLHGINSSHIESVLSVCRGSRSGGQVQLPHGYTATRQFDTLRFEASSPQPSPFRYDLPVPGRCTVAEAGLVFAALEGIAPDLQTMKDRCAGLAFLEKSSLQPHLLVRSRLPGDRYGGEGHRKIKKMLIDRKVPSLQRSVLPMIVSGTDVVWVPGFRPARGYEALPGSAGCVVISIETA